MAMGDNVRSRNKNDYTQARGENLFGSAQGYIGNQGNVFGGQYSNALNSDEQMRNAAMTGFQNYMSSGDKLGLSKQAEGAMRNRAMSPVRSAYDSAKRQIMRTGPATGRNVMMARLAREGGQQASDAASNAEVNIAGLREQAKQGRMQAMLGGATGMSQLYGTTPGMTSLASGNVLQNTNQALNLLGNEFNRMQGIASNQIQMSQLPGKGGSTIQGIKDISEIGRNIFQPTKLPGGRY